MTALYFSPKILQLHVADKCITMWRDVVTMIGVVTFRHKILGRIDQSISRIRTSVRASNLLGYYSETDLFMASSFRTFYKSENTVKCLSTTCLFSIIFLFIYIIHLIEDTDDNEQTKDSCGCRSSTCTGRSRSNIGRFVTSTRCTGTV